MSSNNETRMESTFLKVNRRGGLMNRRIIIDEQNKTMEYHRYRKKLTFHKKSIYSIQDITDLRQGWMTTKFKKIEEKMRRLWMKGKQDTSNNWVREECSFSIVFGTDKTFDLIAADSIEREFWLNKLRYIMFEAKTAKKTKDRRAFVEKCFKEADKDGDRFINFFEAMSILNRLNIAINNELAKELFQKSAKKHSTRKSDEEVLDLDEFFIFFDSLEHRWEVDKLFRQYAKSGGTTMGPEELQQFFKEEQGIDLSLDTCQKYIDKFQTSWYASLSTNLLEASQRQPASSQILELYMNSKGFEAMLTSSEFDLFNQDHYNTHQDMNRPLNHYYILSSHNTYLLAGQLVGDSSIEGYIDAMRRGYRCVELDIWDGNDNEGPIVYHGYTMVSKLLLKDVLEAIGAYAFDTTPYPLILSLEINCSQEQQSSVAGLLVAILGDKLYRRPIIPNERELPSPEMLKNKILVKSKGRPSGSEDTDSSSSESSESEEELNETRRYITDRRYSVSAVAKSSSGKSKKHKISNNLADLAVYCSAKKFRSLEDTLSWKFNEMFSLKETVSADLANFYTKEYIACTAKRLVRIYPKGSRFNSSNYDPTIHWNVGCQMVALNVQTLGKHLLINEARFATNGHCGYALKPDFLMKTKEGQSPKPLRLELTVLSGQHLRNTDASPEDDIIDPYVKISVIGHGEDRQKMTTKAISNNGFNPIWLETFVLTINFPELAFLYFKVKDERLSGKDAKLAGNVIAVTSMRTGYRHLQLLDNRGKKIDGCTLFLKVHTE
ncbi:1-phosphatidylinositol 4,5-bisphosphate phosphodiesterase eta-2 [Tetranychus urticae]|uniref:Phosphoinositide phospholipase C n=1 Tax=Tetranychus urticae TaxID=32264 RepID=T1KSZ2_TETUR|nr:1-phosphatidylinositol 4,5-bisphosphate phosphodiesterase eta-2 [Tetranychus urticae]XP_015790133.1 1-phosphatidylinositol 4,5-bisphosphate phosphodiesterase eta-2 [Tetranychus urticae]XP_025017618.1 1-phosphatidylinositol 4,5-bisphosphate phosphodiesterase eta-2 [Tetranychus urticae]